MNCTLGKRNLNIKDSHYQILDESYQITKPTIICLGGNATLSNKDANAICKTAQRLIGLKQPTTEGEFATAEDVDILGITYAPTFNKYGKKLQTSQLSHNDVAELTEQLLYPLVIDEDGEKLSIEKACKNITSITFLSHSMGTRETSRIIQHLALRMLESGYNKEETNNILGNITSVSFGPYLTISECNQQINGSSFPDVQQFNIKSLKDNYDMEYEFRTGKSADDLHGIDIVKSKNSNNEYDIYADHFTTSSNDDHMISRVIFRNENWENSSWDKDKFGNHWYVGENADAASQCAAFILATSVANGLQNSLSPNFIPKPTAEQLADECKDIVTSFNEDLTK